MFIMSARHLISWLGKKRLLRLRCLAFYCVILCFFFSLHYWNGRLLTPTENEVVNYPDGERSYFYIRDSELKDDSYDISGSEVYIHSAYYDNRALSSGQALLRIFANVYWTNNPVFCCFQVTGYDTWICTKYLANRKLLSSSKHFDGYSAGPSDVTEVMFSCVVNEQDLGGLRLTNVVLISVRNEAVTKVSKPHDISYGSTAGLRERSSKVTKFTVCIVPSFRGQKRRFATRQDIFEYFELLKLLGTAHVISYYGESAIAAVLRKVKGLSQVTVRSQANVTLSSTLATNDCLYRSLADADYVVFLDVNEVLIPNTTRDWSAMIDSLQRVHNTTKVGAYLLQAFNFYDETTNNTASDSLTSGRGAKMSRLNHLPRIVRFRAREKNTAPDGTVLGEPVKIEHITSSGSIKMLPGYINVNVPVDYAAVHRFIHDRHIYKGLTVDATKDKFVPLLMRKLYSLGNLVH